MKVDFNNLRKQACIAYDRLASTFNEAIAEYEDEHGEKGLFYMSCHEIQKEMDSLRMLIGTIAMCHNEGDPDVIDVYEELYPDGAYMVDFNPDGE